MVKKADTRKGDFVKISNILKKFNPQEDRYISREFQQFGYDLAKELDDLQHTSLYIKLAKTTPRGLLESARSFVKDAENARNRGRLFMWKLSELKKQAKRTHKRS